MIYVSREGVAIVIEPEPARARLGNISGAAYDSGKPQRAYACAPVGYGESGATCEYSASGKRDGVSGVIVNVRAVCEVQRVIAPGGGAVYCMSNAASGRGAVL